MREIKGMFTKLGDDEINRMGIEGFVLGKHLPAEDNLEVYMSRG